MKRKQLLFLLTLLMTAATGAWAQVTTNVVTQANFYNYFDTNGKLLDANKVTYDELIFQGEFSNLVGCITIDRSITITGDNAVLNNIGFVITAEDVTLDKVSVTYNAPSEVEAKAIFANGADNFTLINSTITFTGANPGEYHYRGLEVRDCDGAVIDKNTITATLPAVAVDWMSSAGIAQDLVLAVGIQGGNDVEFTNNTVTVNTNGGIGSYPTIDAVMVYSANDILIKGNNITHLDTTPSDGERYYYSLDIYDTTGTVEANDIIINTTVDTSVYTTASVDRGGSAYPIQLTGPFTVTVIDNNITVISKGPVAGIYASNWNGVGDLTVENNIIDVTGYVTTGNYALVSGIEAQIEVLKAYNNTITVANGAGYDNDNQIYGVSMATSYMSGDVVADIKYNNMTVDGQYAVCYLKANKTNVIGNTLIAHKLTGNDAVYIKSGDYNTIEENLPINLTALTYSRTLAAPGSAEGSGDTQIDDMPANLFTVCLPFTPKTSVAVRYYTLSGVSGETVNFAEVASPVANTPYLIAVIGSENFTESCENLKVSSMTINSTTVDGYTFNGTFTGMTNADARGKYILQSNNRWGKVTAENSAAFIPAFRAFIEGPANGARKLSGSLDGGDGSATGIKYIRTQNIDGTEHYFDLNGRRIEKPATKGIYIHNGKKVVIK